MIFTEIWTVIVLLSGINNQVVLIGLTVKQEILCLHPKRRAQLGHYTFIIKSIQGQDINYLPNVMGCLNASENHLREVINGGLTNKVKTKQALS